MNKINYNEYIETLPEMEFVSYGYPKYGNTVFAVKLKQGNLQLVELSHYLSNGLYIGYLETKDFCEALGERMALCMNYCRNKTNKELEDEINARKDRGAEQEHEGLHQRSDERKGKS